jgi:ketosteroid isomerase-like protein
MRHILAIAAMMVAVPVSVFAHAQGTAASSNDEQALMKLEQEFTDILLKGDGAALERLLADTLTLTEPDGTIRDKAGFVAVVKSGELKFASLQTHDMKVQVYGDTAVVTYHVTEKVTVKGQDRSGESRWTDVFVRQGGRWQLVAAHGSRIGAPPRP